MRLLEHRLNVNGFCTSPDHLISIRYTNVFGVVRAGLEGNQPEYANEALRFNA
jgi:hypothetical protein